MILPPYISSSMISSFNECPKRWAASHFYGKKGNEDGFAFGTAFHNVMEHLWEDAANLYDLTERYFPDDEEDRGMVYDAVRDLQSYDETNHHVSLGREIHFELPISDRVIVTGHIDQVLRAGDNTLIVRDFKTNRNIEPAVVWTNRIQPRIYNWAARELFPDYEKVLFQIVYPRYAHRVTWEMRPEGPQLLDYVERVWRQIQAFYEDGVFRGDITAGFEAVLNAYCGWCAIRSECFVYQSVSSLRELPMVDSEGPGARYNRLSLLKKAIESHMSDAKRQVRANMNAEDSEYREDGLMFRMTSQNRVSYDTESVWPDFINWLRESGQHVQMAKLISFSTTGVTAFLREHPELEQAFQQARSVKKTEESLTVIKSR